VEENCQLAEHVCYLVQVPCTDSVDPNSGDYKDGLTVTILRGLKNPTSIRKAGKITVRTMLRRATTEAWSQIDEGVLDTGYAAERGEIPPATIIVEPPAIAAGVVAE
jgi:hypothetical protein